MDQDALLAWGRVMDKPGFLEFQPALGIEVVQLVRRHKLIVNGKL
jgi:hypothetical protein